MEDNDIHLLRVYHKYHSILGGVKTGRTDTFNSVPETGVDDVTGLRGDSFSRFGGMGAPSGCTEDDQ